MNKNLRKAVMTGFGIAALAGVSTQASAIATNPVGTGTLNGSFLSLTSTGTVGAYGWDGQNNGTAGALSKNYGWAHSARWFLVSVNDGVGANGVNISLAKTNSVSSNPAFSVWQTDGNFTGGNHSSSQKGQAGMSFNQVADQTAFANTWLAIGGGKTGAPTTTDGVTAFVGYANGGSAFTNGASTSVTGTNSATASLYLNSLSIGQYLIALGGSCNLANCGSGSASSLAYNLVA
jgi:hypothetical protein